MRFIIISLLVISHLSLVVAQNAQPKKPKATGDPKAAEEYFKSGNFEYALDEYLILIKKEPENEKYNYRIGVCYINTDIDKTKAISYLEKIKDKTSEPETKYLLGRAYLYAYKFDDAIKMLNEYKKEGKGSAENMKDLELEAQYCLNAKELMKYPVNVNFENLGKNINSEYPDYFPFVPADESFIIFNSKRPESGSWQNPDGSWTSNIYISRVKDGQFTKTKLLGRVVNTMDGEEEAVGLSASGDYLLIYYDNFQGSGDIYISKCDKAKNFKEPILLDEQINSQRGQEIAASITADGNAIYFASTRPGGFGGSDIYVCRRLPTGKWGPAQNLGEEINTPYNEDFPNISPDGKTLYFSSMGHTSMGGYDIFFAKYDDKKNLFNDAKNLGYPINSTQDDMNFRVSANGKYGYISIRRKDGLGDLDIYRLDFIDVDPDYTVVTGKVRSADVSKPVDSTHVFISVADLNSGDDFGSYMPNPNSGKYVIILPPGKFSINTEIPGYLPYSEKIEILGKSSFKSQVEKNIMLTPEGGSSSKPNNKK
ncbi:MAG: PD40 domain-containing protein [Bacteroidetes bacterium]|nr:PD40 domain-containing protein [Bacteroidota bacterium]